MRGDKLKLAGSRPAHAFSLLAVGPAGHLHLGPRLPLLLMYGFMLMLVRCQPGNYRTVAKLLLLPLPTRRHLPTDHAAVSSPLPGKCAWVLTN